MRFIFSVAFKYLIPRWRQLSVSIISLVSILVISLVVWLVVVFLSVTEGIEKNWIKQLVALNAPLRLTPTDAYYKSYYYLIDGVSSGSAYVYKTIDEKRKAPVSDPFDPTFDAELAPNFPKPHLHSDGTLVDPVKETWSTIENLKVKNLRAAPYEVAFANFRITLNRNHPSDLEASQTYLTQASYVAAYDPANVHLHKLLLPLTTTDLGNLLTSLDRSSSVADDEGVLLDIGVDAVTLRQKLVPFFSNVSITALKTAPNGFIVPPSLYPKEGSWEGYGIVQKGKIRQVYIPAALGQKNVQELLTLGGYEIVPGRIDFKGDTSTFIPATEGEIAKRLDFVLEGDLPIQAKLLPASVESASSLASIQFEVQTTVQGIPLAGVVAYRDLELAEATATHDDKSPSPLWVFEEKGGSYLLPQASPLGEGILLGKNFRQNGVLLGDTGFLSYYTPTASGLQEQRLPVYVAGFYDPGLIPTGSRLLFADPKVVESLRTNFSVSDKAIGNGIQVWFSELDAAESVKKSLLQALQAQELDRYWTVESFSDYEFSKPLLQQLQSDKNLFTLIAIIILLVACSNIVSMLILLVNDKKREIGILQSMGATSWHIAGIFGICGFFTGLLSSVVGTIVAIFTLRHLQSLVNFLSFLQGQEAFQTAFYGSELPNELSLNALSFIVVATIVISLLAGVAPAIKAVRIRPTEILRAD